MAQLTTEDLKSWATSYESTREVGDVLIGEDTARPIMEAVSSGNDAALQSLLSQPQWSKILVEKPHRIYQEASSEGANGVRRVMAAPTSNLEWALTVAAQNGNGAAAAVSTLLACAKQYHDINAYDVVNYSIINQIIRDGHADIFKALVSSDPKIANFPLLHGTLPLYEAVRLRQPDVVAVLLECGADPFHPVQESKQLQGYRSSLLSWAAYADGPRITELLLQHRVPIANSAALHTAASTGALDTMRVLIQHGADVNEALATMRNWTPLHFAHSRGRVDAVKLLEQSGAKADAKDGDGKTPAQLLEERNT